MKRALTLLLAALLVTACGSVGPTSPTGRLAFPGGLGTDPTYRGPQALHGGPVQADPRIVLVYWGPVWATGAFQVQVKAAEQQMLARLPGSPWGAVLGQYGVNNDIRLIRSWTDPAAPPAGRQLGYKRIGLELDRASLATRIPPSLDVTWIVFPPPTARLRNFVNECGEHDNHENFVYALVQPFDTRTFGSGRTSCAQYDAYGNNKIAATTSLTSHEIVEAATDPLSAKGNGTGWWGPPAAKRFGMGAAEIGDYCYAQAVQPWGSTGPTVQAVWSQQNAGPLNSHGCVDSLAGGAPRLVGQTGPTSRPGSLPADQPAARYRLRNS